MKGCNQEAVHGVPSGGGQTESRRCQAGSRKGEATGHEDVSATTHRGISTYSHGDLRLGYTCCCRGELDLWWAVRSLIKLGIFLFYAIFGGWLLFGALTGDQNRASGALGGLSGIVAACLLLSLPWYLSYDGLPAWLVYLPLGLTPLAIMIISPKTHEDARINYTVRSLGVLLPSLLLIWHRVQGRTR
jgi:hypothetical protein